MKVFVVMGNDFPAEVFATEQDADDFCVDMREEGKELAKKHPYPRARISWRVYEFEVQESYE